ncbi:MAG: Gx transporter family protein [Bacillota bacterium]
MPRTSRTFFLVYLALLVAMAMALHALEAMMPLPHVVPGAKLGLANIIALYAVVMLGLRSALVVSVLRTFLGSLVSGTFLTFGYMLSFSGALLSTVVMWAVYRVARGRVSLVGVSIAGAVTHNLTQLGMAALLLRQLAILVYLPHLLFFAIPTGMFIGLVTNRLRVIGIRTLGEV